MVHRDRRLRLVFAFLIGVVAVLTGWVFTLRHTDAPDELASAEHAATRSVGDVYSGGHFFQTKQPSKPGDWLAEPREETQTFEQYVQGAPIRRTDLRFRIVLQPLGELTRKQEQLLELMAELARAFFSVPVERADAIPLPNKSAGEDAKSMAGPGGNMTPKFYWTRCSPQDWLATRSVFWASHLLTSIRTTTGASS